MDSFIKKNCKSNGSIFKILINNYILKGKIEILKYGHKTENLLYILYIIYSYKIEYIK